MLKFWQRFGLLIVACLLTPSHGLAFCGFYVAKGDAALFNDASRVVIARHEQDTVITMANDFRGEADDFAMVVPVPYVLSEEDIRVRAASLIDHLDDYTAPRLVEYFDEDPCNPIRYRTVTALASIQTGPVFDAETGVTIEAEYEVGEYDIQILSGEQSAGLLTWLHQNGYKLPAHARPILADYLDAGMKFFVARVDVERLQQTETKWLSPLQLQMKTEALSLPIRLGTINADGKQELFVFLISDKGRILPSNYPVATMPSDIELPPYVGETFGETYPAIFTREWQRQNERAVVLEHAWDMSWCDPCAADPLSRQQLIQLGANWLNSEDHPSGDKPEPRMAPGAVDAFVTRLHLRYDAETFPDDLTFYESSDRTNFQTRYILRHAFKGDMSCPAGKIYQAVLPQRYDVEAHNLARLTGWNFEDIRAKHQ